MRRIILHPFLLLLFSILSLFAANIELVLLSNVLRTILIGLGLVSILMIAFFILIRDWHRAGLISSLIVLLFISFGHVYNFLVVYLIQRSHYLRADVMIAIWAAVLIFGGWLIIRKVKSARAITGYLNAITMLLVLFSVLQICAFQLKARTVAPLADHTGLSAHEISVDNQSPDVYYIILDEYGRSDVLAEILDYDNSAFIDGLKEKGFFVADASFTNYAITLQSLASSLNSTYLDAYISEGADATAVNTRQMIELVRENRATQTFLSQNYRFVSVASGYSFTEFTEADYYFAPQNYINDFELEYLKSTAAVIALDTFQATRSRTLIENSFDRLASMPEIATDRPKFVFAHIMAGHVPFVFGPNGEPVPLWAFSINPGDERYAGRTYVSAYHDQVEYINKRLLGVIDVILTNSKVKPIIIIQGDHGPESRLDWTSIENTCLSERMSILNAYYFPGIDPGMFYPSLSPVNTFRMVFDHYLGMEEGLLEDRSYFSLWAKSYQFIDVTNQVNTCNRGQ